VENEKAKQKKYIKENESFFQTEIVGKQKKITSKKITLRKMKALSKPKSMEKLNK